MKKITVAVLTLLLAHTSLSAALPPAWQHVAEVKAILNDPQLKYLLTSGDLIQEIKKSEDGWTIITNHHELHARVVYKQQSMPGPAKFIIEFDKAQMPHEYTEEPVD